jgi:hypothetical protein
LQVTSLKLNEFDLTPKASIQYFKSTFFEIIEI